MKKIFMIPLVLGVTVGCSGSSGKSKKDSVLKEPVLDVVSYKSCTIIEKVDFYTETCMDFSSSTYTSEQIEEKCNSLKEAGLMVELSTKECGTKNIALPTNGYCEKLDENGQKIQLRYVEDSQDALAAKKKCESQNGNYVLDNPVSCTYTFPGGPTQCFDLSFSGKTYEEISTQCLQGASEAGLEVTVLESPCLVKFNGVNSLGTCQIHDPVNGFEILTRDYDPNKSLVDHKDFCENENGIWNVDL